MTDITSLSALELSAKIESKALTSVQVVSAYLDRIEQFNPKINAIISLRPRVDILADALLSDETPRRGWLSGLPIAIKDLADTKGIRTTSGSPILAEHVPTQDCLMVQRIKQAGALVIGKTNTPEFGLGSHTFNPVHGVTSNPYATDLTAGGSSGGAAAAIAMRLLPVADGSDMMGSLRNPAAFCNVYGYRPSWGAVPDEPSGEMFLQHLATAGPMGRSPADIAALLQTMAGPDSRWPHNITLPKNMDDLSKSIVGKRIGWLGDWGGAYPCENGILDQCKAGLSGFEQLGCEVISVDPPFDAAEIWSSWITLRSWAVMCGRWEDYKDQKRRALLKPAMIWEIERGLALSAQDIHLASEIRSAWFRKFVQLSNDYDALALPAAQVWPFPKDWIYPEKINNVTMDTYHRWMEIVVPVSLIGLPCLAMPTGFSVKGVPMGVQMFGPRGSDRDLLTLGQAYHNHHDWTATTPKL